MSRSETLKRVFAAVVCYNSLFDESSTTNFAQNLAYFKIYYLARQPLRN